MNALNGLSIWNRACELAVEAYLSISDCPDLNFRDRITKSSLLVPSDIAKGYERKSEKQFPLALKNAKSSCAELRTQLYIAAQLDLITLQKSTQLMQESLEISRMLQDLIDWCETRAEPPSAAKENHPGNMQEA
jgi:four helix bundle protein